MTFSLIALGAFFIAAGVTHFINPRFYLAMMPRFIPREQHAMIVKVSGVCEIAGGIGVLIAPVRQLAGIGLILLLIAVFPANVQMLMNGYRAKASAPALAALWIRLPLQGLLLYWVASQT